MVALTAELVDQLVDVLTGALLKQDKGILGGLRITATLQPHRSIGLATHESNARTTPGSFRFNPCLSARSTAPACISPSVAM
ncbi:hypothetical protein [Micromonospora inositola]|uniref:Uncharacterized protein n=1 Tax=Micromonospora inositola TaxID=47865 RepID=A0A1C5JS23_9ACTN|nr:hypothetical protein [Micromonospora inositola]SCG73039.1 hypothetical protein GA0070613_5222 [Micromonospora inositola]